MWKIVLAILGSSAAFSGSLLLPNTAPRRIIGYFFALQIPIHVMYLSMTPSHLVQEHCSGQSGRDEPEVKRQTILNSLRELAVDQIRSGDAFLGKRRVSVDQQSHTLSYDLRPAPLNFVLSEADPDALPLEALIRVEALRRDFAQAISSETFWSASLAAIQQSIGRCVPISESEPQSGQHRCKDIDAKFEELRGSIETYAAAHGLRVIEAPQARSPVVGYRVGIKVDPPKARVRVMTLLEYKKYQYFKTPPNQYQWSDLLDSEVEMIGWYHYRAEWPSELNGPEEGNIEIKQPGTLTFRPKQR